MFFVFLFDKMTSRMTINLLFCVLLSSIFIVDGHVFDEQLFLDNLRDNTVIESLYYPYLNRTIDLLSHVRDDPMSTISDQCAKNIDQIRTGLLMKEKWALMYYESNGFPKNGRLNGDYSDLGSYDQCLAISKSGTNVAANFETQFCLVSISTPEWSQLLENEQFSLYFNRLQESTKNDYKFNLGKILGICLPANCDMNLILKSVNRILLPLGLNATSQQHCTKNGLKSNEPLTYKEIIALSIFGSTITLCLLAHFYKENSFLGHFSITKNLSRVYDYNPYDTKTRSTDYLHGLKCMLVCSSIGLHCFGIIVFHSPFLYAKIRNFHAGPLQIMIDRIFLFADILFFYGGFFAMFSWYDSIKKINVTPYRYIFTRFLRIFTVSVMVILLTFLMPLISTGPYYNDLMEKCSSNCVKNLWKNLLLINNQGSYLEVCFLPTWYLSADFQLYLLNYFLIHLLVKKPKVGLILAGIELFFFSSFVIIYDYLNNIPYYYKFSTRLESTSTFKLEEHYLPTFYHSNTFVMGILAAWAIKSGLKFKFLERERNIRILTVLALLSIFIALTLPELWESKLIPQNKLLIIIWSVVDKFMISLAVQWTFYAISFNHFSILKKLSSLRIWIPISQISFSMIMCQFLYFFYLTGTQKVLYSFDWSNLWKEYAFSLPVTFLISNLTFVFFETPVTNLLLKLFNLNRRRDIKVDNLDVQYDYDEMNNNNPDFKPIKKLD